MFSLISLSLFSGGCTPKEKVNVYFAKYEDNHEWLAPQTRTVAKDENFYKNVIWELIKGPSDGQYYPTLPSSVKINYVKIEGELAIADFSKEIITDNTEIPHSSTTESLAIFSIVDTLTEFEEINKVRITVDGKTEGQIEGLYIEDFWGHIGIYEDFYRNEEILEKNREQ
ncbi:MAG: GerMN domain-containing protein [Actinobacteria bacterium]|nr:GerMN domain-containing protein [Actinomycetota bacterium]